MPYKCSSSNCQKYKLPKFFQSLVHEKCKLWFLSINELLIIYWQKNIIYTFHLLKIGKIEVTCIFGSFNYHKENMPLLCVFQKIFWNTAFTGVVYYVNIKTSSTSQNSLGVISINSRTADPILDVWSGSAHTMITAIIVISMGRMHLNTCMRIWHSY